MRFCVPGHFCVAESGHGRIWNPSLQPLKNRLVGRGLDPVSYTHLVNLSAQNVTVWTKADADEEVIRKAIRDAGYLPLRTKEKV